MACVKTACERNYDYIEIYDTGLWHFIQLATILCLLIAIIIIIFKVGFLSALCYLGIGIGTIFIGQFTVTLILVSIFGYQYLGAIMPALSAIASAIWMFTQIGSL